MLFLVFLHVKATAQSADYEIDGYSTLLYTDESGLPQNSVKSICSGNNGQIWFTTEDGLVEFDGNRFTTYDKWTDDPARFHITSMYNYKRFAVTTKGAYIDISGDTPQEWGNVRWSYEYLKEFIPSECKPSYINYSPYRELDVWIRYGALVIPDNDIFYVLYENTLYCVSTQKKVLWKKILPNKDIHLFMCNHHLLLNAFGDDKIISINPSGKNDRIIPINFEVQDFIWNKAEQQLFIVTKKNEILYINNNVGIEKLLTVPKTFTITSILYENETNTVFIGSGKNGLLLCKKQQFRTYGDFDLNASVFYSIAPYSDTAVIAPYGYIIGQRGSSQYYLKKTGFSTSSITRYKNDEFLTMSPDYNLISYSASKGEKITVKEIDEPKSIWVENNTVWVGFSYLGFQKITDGKATVIPIDGIVRDIFPLSDDYFLLATEQGITVLEKSSCKSYKLAATEGIAVREIKRSSRGIIYATTENNGLLLLEYDGIKKLPLDKNEYLKFCHTINEDSQNRFWITCNKGLFCIPEKDLLNQKPNRNGHIFYYYFGKENGFKTNEFNGGVASCSAKLNSGEFVLSSLNGLVWFNPDSTNIEFPSHKLKLKYTVLDDTLKIVASDTIEIDDDFRRMEIFLSCPFFGDKKNIQLEYNLDDDDENQWIETDINSSLVFPSLKPGYNVIKFRVRNGFGENAYTYLNVVYYRVPEIWERQLFYPAIILLVIVVGFVLYKMRTKTLEKRNENLQKAVQEGKKTIVESYSLLEQTTDQLKNKTRFQNWLITSIVHDLRGPLRFIGQYGHFYENKEELNKEEMGFFKSVLTANKSVYSYSEQLLQMLKLQQSTELLPEELDIEKIIIDRLDGYKKELEFKKIRTEFHLVGDKHMAINRAAISIIVQNLVDNAVKVQNTGAIVIHFENKNDTATLTFMDEGPGMPEDILKRLNKKDVHETEGYPEEGGLGMWLVLSMVKNTGGEIEFKNNEIGLCITITWRAIIN